MYFVASWCQVNFSRRIYDNYKSIWDNGNFNYFESFQTKYLWLFSLQFFSLLTMIEVHNVQDSVCQCVPWHMHTVSSPILIISTKLKSNLRFGIYNQQVQQVPWRVDPLFDLHLNWLTWIRKTKQKFRKLDLPLFCKRPKNLIYSTQ